MQSHPMRVRGLKHVDIIRRNTKTTVAPHAGAWIETKMDTEELNALKESHPMRVRGLKPHSSNVYLNSLPPSHPMRVRGLKPF